jgi:hypothetical protein
MTLAWATELPAGEKLVLLALADCANDEGHCWPGVRSLAAKTGKSERSLQDALKALELAGQITRDQVVGKGCNYTVHPRKNCTPAESAPRKSRTTPPQNLRETPAKSAPKPSLNHQEPSESSSDDDVSLRPEHVFEFYRDVAVALGLTVPRDLTPERRQLTKARIAQYSLDDFKTVFAKCRDSPFLRGDRGRTPLTYDWLMKKANFQKVLEGNYDG